MKLSFIIKLALRDLKGYKLRSVLTIGGVAIGIGFIVFLLSLGFGLERLITSQITDIEALKILDVTPGKSKIVHIDESTLTRFKDLGALDAIEPSASVPGKIEYKTSVTDGVIYAKNLEYLPLEGIKPTLGSSYSSNKAKEGMINITALKQLGVKNYKDILDEKIKATLIIPSDLSGSEEAKSLQKTEEFKIVGVLENESSPYIYVPLSIGKDMGIIKYNNLKAKVQDKNKVDIVKKQVENLGFKVTAVKDTVSQIAQFFTIFKFILVGFGLIAMIVASLGMFNTLTISLLEKTREIGLMKVLGTTNRDIHRIFLAQALVIGLIGGVSGIALGFFAGNALNYFILRLAIQTGNQPINIFYIPLRVVLIIFSFSVIISFITGFYPSKRATKISALNALRYE